MGEVLLGLVIGIPLLVVFLTTSAKWSRYNSTYTAPQKTVADRKDRYMYICNKCLIGYLEPINHCPTCGNKYIMELPLTYRSDSLAKYFLKRGEKLKYYINKEKEELAKPPEKRNLEHLEYIREVISKLRMYQRRLYWELLIGV